MTLLTILTPHPIQMSNTSPLPTWVSNIKGLLCLVSLIDKNMTAQNPAGSKTDVFWPL